MAIHTIEPERQTLHGHFSRDLPPALTIDSGDTVRFRTLDASWGIEPPPPGEMWPAKDFSPRTKGKDDGHALCGPVEIRDAQPGMTLEIRINEIKLGTWGWGGAFVGQNERCQKLGVADGDSYQMRWELDPENLIGRSQHGHAVRLNPFMGVMGMPPAEPGIHSTGPPRNTGGNLDCKELTVGSSLFLPIAVPGGLFSTGDGHAVQGDGESSGVAIECPMDLVDLTFHLRKDLNLSTPRARTPDGWLTFGLDEDLNEATIIALSAMMDLMYEQYNFERKEALGLASLVVDLRITQIVNGCCGVHAFLPDGALLDKA